MGLPKKALRESQLQLLTAGSAVNDGSHQIYRVTFIENNVPVSAFFKKLDPKHHYPELLAKISVAVSLFKRLFQGKNSAEERLVFDDNDRLVGTLSIAIDGFKPFNYSSEPVPLDPAAKERVIPSTKTLLLKQFVKVLFGRWFLDDDDPHPHNVGFKEDGNDSADIDFDMFLYWFTIYMKEPRPIIGVPKKRVELTVNDWESFPKVKDSKPYHWATFKHPGQETLPGVIPSQLLMQVLPKSYADPTQFEQLAHEQEAHEQKFAAALSALLTFHPDMVRKRLYDLFGDMTLNYTSLDNTDVNLRIKYETEFPTLCNEQTNVKPFIDFMMDAYQKHYDNLYRVVVFYMGCENNGYGVPLPATSSALYHKPSFYKDILAWVQEQNATLYSKEDKAAQYDPDEMQKRYHQVWRDAYAPSVRDLLHQTYYLTYELLSQVSSSKQDIIKIEGKKVTDESLTQAWELFGTMPEMSLEKVLPLINVDKDSKLREALLLLVEFTSKFHDVVKDYYSKERKDLTEEDNLVFSDKLTQLYSNYNLKIRQSLAHTSTHASVFNLIASRLKLITEQVNFKLHLTYTDELMHDAVKTVVNKDVLPHTHDEEIKKFNDSLFLWAKSLAPEDLSQYINDIIDKHYAPIVPGLLTARHRTQPVKDFLLASMNDGGDNRLAYILSSGNEDTGALNTLLIQHLTPHMLQTYPLLSVRNAVRDGSFTRDIAIFTKSAVNFAKYDSRFTHLFSPEGMKLFYQTMYQWIDSLDSKAFKKIIQDSLKEYEGGLSVLSGWWSNGSRRKEVEGYCNSSGQSKAVALTFLKGLDTSTLNGTLFNNIIIAMKADISKSTEKQQIPGNKLILKYNATEHKTFYFDGLKTHAVAPSHKQDVSANSSSAMALGAF
jgi:hypothetical protein